MTTYEQAQKAVNTAEQMIRSTDDLTPAEIVAGATGRWSDTPPPAPADDTPKEHTS